MSPKYMLPILLFLLTAGGWNTAVRASVCTDTVKYVHYKNTGSTSGYTLVWGSEERAAQTYQFSHTGTLRGARVYGTRLSGQLDMRVLVYATNAANRPVTLLDSSAWSTWGSGDQTNGFKDFNFNRPLSFNFACAVQIRQVSGTPQFSLRYTGNGEGAGENLPSLYGPGTGNIWVSTLGAPYFRDGDFYIVPRFESELVSDFNVTASCVPAGGSVTFTSTGAVSVSSDKMFNQIALPGYTGGSTLYQWALSGGTLTSGTLTSPNITVQYPAAGCYTASLTVTHHGWTNSCTHVYSYTVSAGLSVSASGVSGTMCHSSNDGYTPDGDAILTITGGCPDYIISLSTAGFSRTDTSSGVVNYTTLPPGSYTALIADDNPAGCSATANFTIAEPPVISFTSATASPANCGLNNGGISSTATGGTGGLQYRIDGGALQATGNFSSLSAGTHTLTAIDASGCSLSIPLVVPNIGGPTLFLVSTQQVSCFGGTNGKIVLGALGGSGTKYYSVDGISFTNTTGIFLGLPAGTYPIQVKDSAGCIGALPAVTLTQPDSLELTLSVTPVGCSGGSDGIIHIVSASGGTGPLTFSPDNITFSPSSSISGIAPGPHTVWVMDSLGCKNSDTISMPVPDSVDAVASPSHLSCYGSPDGEITITASGGVGGYEYQINAGAWQTSNVFSGLLAGTYSIAVRDSNGCMDTTSVVITQPTTISATLLTTDASCGDNNGQIQVIASGGYGGFLYSADGGPYNTSGLLTGLGAGIHLIEIQDSSGCSVYYFDTLSTTPAVDIVMHAHTGVTCHDGSDGSITLFFITGGIGSYRYSLDGAAYIPFTPPFVIMGVTGGPHTVVVSDNVGCTDTLNVTLYEPAGMTITVSVSDVLCHGDTTGTVMGYAGGGAGTLSYSLDGVNFQLSNVFTGLTAGTYLLTVMDAGGCRDTTSFTIAEPPPVSASALTTDVTCPFAGDGTISASAGGGTGGFTFSLDLITWDSTGNFSGLSGGIYTVYVRDSGGCVNEMFAVVGEPSELDLSGSKINHISCVGANDGSISAIPAGGTPPFSYVWSTGDTTFEIGPLAPGTYTVTITDDHGCVMEQTFGILESTSLIYQSALIFDADCGTPNGSINLAVAGGTSPYSYFWHTSSGFTAYTQDLSSIPADTYIVEITDLYGCTSIDTYVVDCITFREDEVSSASWEVFPNPASDVVNIRCSATLNRVLLTDLSGKILMDEAAHSHALTLQLPALPGGVYILSGYTGDRLLSQRLVILQQP